MPDATPSPRHAPSPVRKPVKKSKGSTPRQPSSSSDSSEISESSSEYSSDYESDEGRDKKHVKKTNESNLDKARQLKNATDALSRARGSLKKKKFDLGLNEEQVDLLKRLTIEADVRNSQLNDYYSDGESDRSGFSDEDKSLITAPKAYRDRNDGGDSSSSGERQEVSDWLWSSRFVWGCEHAR